MSCPLRAERDRIEQDIERLRIARCRRIGRLNEIRKREGSHGPACQTALAELKHLNWALKKLGKQHQGILKAICEANGGEALVTDHALLRWLERRHGLDRRAVEKEILSFFGPECRAPAHTVVERDGWAAVVRHGRIATVRAPWMTAGDTECYSSRNHDGRVEIDDAAD